MRVGLIGNQNNNFFALCRYLRDAGYDASLHPMAYEGSQPHFQCDSDTFCSEYKEFTEVLPWEYGLGIKKTSKKSIKSISNKLDYIIGCGLAPAYLAKIGRSIDLFMPHGGDIHTIPIKSNFSMNREFVRSQYYKFTGMRYWQREGIRIAVNTSFEDFMPESKEMLDRVGIRNNFYLGFPMVYIPEYSQSNIDKARGSSIYVERIREIRSKNDILISWPCRLIADKSKQEFIKGQHHGFTALKEISRKCPEKRIKMILFEYGPDVNEARELIRGMGLTPYIEWVPVIARKEIMQINSLVDLVFAEIGPGWFAYGVVWEALALGKPLVTWVNCSKEINKDKVYPHLSARNAKNLIDVIYKTLAERDKVQEVGQAGFKWVNKFFDLSVALIGEAIEGKKQKSNVDVFQKYRSSGAQNIFDFFP